MAFGERGADASSAGDMNRPVGSSPLERRSARWLRVRLIRCPTITTVGAVGQDAVPPLGLAYIAGALQAAGHEVRAVDAVGEAVHQYSRTPGSSRALIHGLSIDEIVARIEPTTDVVGVSCMFSVEWPIAEALLTAIRRALPQALIVVGGEHVTACPEFTLETCRAVDVGVLGEGEETILDVLDAHASGRDLASVPGIVFRNAAGAAVRTARRERIRAVDDIPAPAWHLFPVAAYIDNALTHGANLGRCMPILASRGCPYQCTFCSSPLMWTTRWSARRPDAVLTEMKEYIRRYAVTNFDFYDLTAIVKREWIMEFCRLLIAERLDITWQLPSGTRSEAIDGEVADALYAAGCRIINYAPESGSPPELARIKKKIEPRRMLASMRSARRAGIAIKANFVFGFPGSTWSDVRRTLAFIVRLAWIGVDDINAFPFSPYPGSALFDQLVAAQRVRLDGDYFRTLLVYTDPANSISYADFIGSRRLSWLNVAAMALFYGISWSLRPARVLKLAWAFAVRDTSTKLTMALANRRRRRMAMRLASKTAEGTATIPAVDRPAVWRAARL